MYLQFGKRTLDILIATIALGVFFVPMLAVALWVKLDSDGPILFKQLRSGKDRKPFVIYKFRTMSTDAPKDAPTSAFKDAGSYITRSGRIMRKLSLDEMPQIFNVLKGDMSIIGPRPVVLKEKNLLKLRQKVGANGVKPGLSGWAQVNGRDQMNDIIKARYDGEYVEKMSFRKDVKILYLTFVVVMLSRGVQEGHEVGIGEMMGESSVAVDEG